METNNLPPNATSLPNGPHSFFLKLLVPLLSCAWIVAGGTAPAADAQHPNIVLIFADDLGYGDIGPFGSKLNRTPCLDRMAQEGIILRSFYAAPVCTPSRAQVITGCYAKRVSMPNVISPMSPRGLNPDEPTVASLLKQQGYATFIVGKWHLGDQPQFLPTHYGFDHYFGLPYSNDMGDGEDSPPAPSEAAAKGRAQTEPRIVRGKNPPLPLVRDLEVIQSVSPSDQDKLTSRYTDEAVRFIREHRSQPFFLYFPHTAVHVPLHPGENFRGKSANGTYGDWVEEVDWSVGRVLDTLRELKLEQNTLVVFTSDNGPWREKGHDAGTAGPLRGSKGSTFEGGLREPTIAWWPGKIRPGTSSDAVTGSIDLLPTFVKLAGGATPSNHKIDGADIWPVLTGASDKSPREAHYYFKSNRLEAVRSGPWKLAVRPQSEGMGWTLAPDTDTPQPRLYNLVDDIGERNDCAAQHPEIVKKLTALVATMNADLGAEELGPGVRPAGHVDNPKPLLRPGLEFVKATPLPPATKPVSAEELRKLRVGQKLDWTEAPQIAGKAFTISADVDTASPEGVIVAHGGRALGYALYLHDGNLGFVIRRNGTTVAITAATPISGRFHAEARIERNGDMALFANGNKLAEGKAPGLIPEQPKENFCVGFDNGMPVAEGYNTGLFPGTVSNLKIETGE